MHRLLLSCCAVVFSLPVLAAPFQNLGFDEANTDGVMSFGPVSELLPGWELYRGSTSITSLDLDNALSLAATVATLVSRSNFGGSLWEIDGPFGLFLRTGDVQQPFSLVQHGDVPADATILSYSFRAHSFAVTANGQLLRPIGALPGDTGVTGVGGSADMAIARFDISPFAGQTIELRFTQVPVFGFPGSNGENSFIDDIKLIPEPGSGILLAFGIGATLVRSARGRGLSDFIRQACRSRIAKQKSENEPNYAMHADSAMTARIEIEHHWRGAGDDGRSAKEAMTASLCHVLILVLTFGRVDLDWGVGAESVVTEWIGFAFVLAAAGAIVWMWDGKFVGF